MLRLQRWTARRIKRTKEILTWIAKDFWSLAENLTNEGIQTGEKRDISLDYKREYKRGLCKGLLDN